MRGTLKKIYIFTMLFMTLSMIMFLFPVSAMAADSEKIEIPMKYYEYDEDGEYEISSTRPVAAREHNTLGKVVLNGNVIDTTITDKIPHYEIADEEMFSLQFIYDNTLKTAGEKEWHLVDDSTKDVDGVELGEKIKNGAILFQTSYNRKKWVTLYKKTNINEDVTLKKSEYINDIQLLNGCYYRIIVVYKIEKEDAPNNLYFGAWETPIGRSSSIGIKSTEIYEFYASYKNTSSGIPDDIETYKLGKMQAVKVDNGYNKPIDMNSDDPHLGWELGSFVVGGFTNNKKDDNGDQIFLKNNDDRVTLWFCLNDGVDIDKLNNNEKLSINSDSNGYDLALNVPKQNFKRGTMILRYTDYKGKTHDPIIYTDFLNALSYPGANTKIQLFEEGDYEVSLDYEILEDGFTDKIYSYKIAFGFKIRNSNTMVYPKDIVTQIPLGNDSVTENGFVLDWAQSRYLDINVKLSQWTKGVTGYTEDIRFNRAAKESDEYTKTGIYTITVTNPTTDPYGNNPTVKKIYVGSDNILIASMNVHNADYTINQIFDMVENEGYTIDDTGELVPPKITEAVTYIDSPAETEFSSLIDNSSLESSNINSAPKDKQATNNKSLVLYAIVGGGCFMVICAIIIKTKNNEKHNNGGVQE